MHKPTSVKEHSSVEIFIQVSRMNCFAHSVEPVRHFPFGYQQVGEKGHVPSIYFSLDISKL